MINQHPILQQPVEQSPFMRAAHMIQPFTNRRRHRTKNESQLFKIFFSTYQSVSYG